MKSDAVAPLEGLRIVDLTTSVAGPYCSQLLGALGASVIKVERPTSGDDTRGWGPPFWNGHSPTYLAMNANKRSITLDLKTEAGTEVARRLVYRADVFIESMRPGAADRLGLGAGTLTEEHPRLIYCSISAFGHLGPLSHRPGYDPLMQAQVGLMSLTGEPDGPPVRAGFSVVDQGAALWATIGILAALATRRTTGRGQVVRTSLYEAAFNWIPYHVLSYLASGEVPPRNGSGLSVNAPSEVFRAQDGDIMITAPNDRAFRALCEAIGEGPLAEDARFVSNALRVANRTVLIPIIATRISERPVAVWLEDLTAHSVPAAPVRNVADVVNEDQARALGLLQTMPTHAVPDLQLVAPALSLGDERVKMRTAPPELGEHSKEILQELGYGDADIANLRAAKVITATATGPKLDSNTEHESRRRGDHPAPQNIPNAMEVSE